MSGILHERRRRVGRWVLGFIPSAVARAALSGFRSIPEYVWAFMFVRAAGVSRLGIVLYGLISQALPSFVSCALYRWECAIGASAVLGLVGAGGLGQRIHVTISLFLEHQLLTLILAIYAMVTLVDSLSTNLRRRLV